MTRTMGRRTGERKQQVLELTEQAGQAARALDPRSQAAGRGRAAAGAWPRRAGEAAADPQAGAVHRALPSGSPSRSSKRMRGEPITDRLVSIFDPDARPIRKGKLGKPNEFGFVAQICEVTENTRRGARGLIIPATSQLGNPREDTLLPDTVAELQRLGITPREVALDGGFNNGPTAEALERFEPERTFIAGRQQPGSPTNPTAPRPIPHRQPKGGSATSNAATDCAAAASKDHAGHADLDRMGDPRLQP